MPDTAGRKIRHLSRAIKRRARTPREKMQAYRARMRAKGFRLVQSWVPDTSRPDFIAQVSREIDLVRGTRGEREAISLIRAALKDADEWT